MAPGACGFAAIFGIKSSGANCATVWRQNVRAAIPAPSKFAWREQRSRCFSRHFTELPLWDRSRIFSAAPRPCAGLWFNCPIAIGAGEERYANLLRRSFVVTLPVNGCPLPFFLRDHWEKHAPAGISLRQKRQALAQLAMEIRRLHDLGFVHGDLVPGNIFVAPTTDGTMGYCFMDNDRTRRYPTWLPHRLWRRNLVQLNRFPLAGISLQDRMRFFHAYTRRKKLAGRDRKLVHWLELKTRQRRRECDAVDTSGSFRRLMRWDTPGH